MKSTEFGATVGVAAVGLAAASGLLSPEQSEVLNEVIPALAVLISDVVIRVTGLIGIVGSVFGYAKSRGVAKAGEASVK